MGKTNLPIFIAVAVIWAVLFVVFMVLQKKRAKNQSSFLNKNQNQAILHLYCKNVLIDGQNLSMFEPITGEYGQKIVALPAGTHTIEGVFESTETTLAGKTRNIKSEKLSFDLTLKSGHQYSVALYSYSPEERKSYYKDNAGTDIFHMPLTAYEGSDTISAYIICYQED